MSIYIGVPLGEATAHDLEREVLDVFREVTRYPAEILGLDANLEEDLGIDSVKLGEIFSVLRENFDLPEKLEIPPARLKTIAGISAALYEFLAAQMRGPVVENGSATPRPATRPPAAPEDRTRETESRRVHDLASLGEQVQQIFAQVTRYPAEILKPDANLEEDLGIDSVKLGEIFSVLREEYDLPEKMDIAPERLKTIAGISTALHEYLRARVGGLATGNGAAGHEPTASPVAAPPVWEERTESRRVHDLVSLGEQVQQIFAQVTRYPVEILKSDANLEEDLGIDSVKLGEIFSVLREEYDLPEKMDIAPERLKSIAGISTALHEYLGARAGGGSAPTNDHMRHETALRAEGGRSPQVEGFAGPQGASPSATARLDHARIAFHGAPSPQERPFAGKIAFISGSGRGLGQDIAVYLAELGASVVVNSFHSRNRGDEVMATIKDRGGDAWHLWGSMANPEHIHRIFDQIDERYGGLDFFISNASNGMLAPLEELTVEHWEKAFRTNVIGLHQGALRASKLMRKRGGGKIITLSSPAAHGYVEHFGCMGAVKAALESMTRSLAIEFARYNIQVNCVSPGPIDGELLRKWPDSTRLIPQWQQSTPLGRLCEPREVSHFIAYLLSDPVKCFTGSVLVIDGGISSQGW